MIAQAKQKLYNLIKSVAKRNMISKLQVQGVDYLQLNEAFFNELIFDEMEILKNESKQMGVCIGAVMILSLVIGA